MKRRQFIQVKGTALEPPVPVKRRIINPVTNNTCFGTFPEITATKICPGFPTAPIELHHGLHKGPHDGYGLVHIWLEHFPNEADIAAATPVVIAYIHAVLQPGSTIHYEGGLGRDADRTAVLRTSHGLLIIELGRNGVGDPLYSIVTAYPSRNAKGTLVGAF
jgi:hypothetical protein